MNPVKAFFIMFFLAILIALIFSITITITPNSQLPNSPTPVYILIDTPTPVLIDCRKIFIDEANNTLKCWPID